MQSAYKHQPANNTDFPESLITLFLVTFVSSFDYLYFADNGDQQNTCIPHFFHIRNILLHILPFALLWAIQ